MNVPVWALCFAAFGMGIVIDFRIGALSAFRYLEKLGKGIND